MVKPENYILVCGWMVTELGLKGNELLLYAMIYGFTQDNETEFSGSLTYMQEWLGVGSRHTVLDALERLIAKGYIKKRTAIEKGIKRSYYVAAPRGSAETAPGSAETAPGWCKKCTGGSAKTAPNNIEDNLVIYNTPTPRAREERLDADLAQIVQTYQDNVGSFPPMAKDDLQRWRQVFSTEMILLAIGEAAKNNVHSWRYIEKVLSSWQSKGIFTPGDFEAQEQRRNSPGGQQPKRTAAEDYDDIFGGLV